jgi:IclR family acetate operon transcriptional repressor
MPRTSSNSDPTSRGASVIENTVSILRCFAPDRQELGVTEIAPRVGLHKSTVSRILASLEQEGIVEQVPSKRYRLGLGIIAIAGPLLADLDVRRAAYPTLQALTRATAETSALMVWNGAEAITVEQIPSPQPVKHTSTLGSRYRTEGSASVKVFLEAEDGEVRTNGVDYALNDAETSPNEVGIAAPVRDHRGEVVAAVLIAAPKFRTDAERVAELGEHCVQAARLISQRLGGR